jgi:hypothetical protein
MVLVAIALQAGPALEVYFESHVFPVILQVIIEGLINGVMVSACIMDLIIGAMIKLQIFNGYMHDDVILTSFCNLMGYLV